MRVELNPHGAQQLRHRPGGCAHRAGSANANRPKGQIADRRADAGQISTTDQLLQGAAEYQPLIVAYRNGAPVRLSRCRRRRRFASKTSRNAGLSNGKPAVIVIVFRQPGANIIETVDRIRDLLPQLQASDSRRRSI